MVNSLLGRDPMVPLEMVIVTEELNRRPARVPDFASENAALLALGQALADPASNILHQLAESAATLCRAESAGISIAEEKDGRTVFRWHALVGALSSHHFETTARECSPCCAVMERDSLQLFSKLDRHFTCFASVSPRIVEAMLIPFRAQGNSIGTVWVVNHDEHKHFDPEDARLLANLAQFASACYQARTLADSHQEAKRRNDAFLAQLAHELRNPLAPIRNAMEVFRRVDSKEPMIRWGQELIERQVLNLSRLVDDLMDVSRIGRGKLRIHKSTVNLSEVVTCALEAVRPVLKANRQELMFAIPAKPIWLEADQGRVTQIVINLLNNAAKYTEDGRGIWVSLEQSGMEGVLSVRDEGVGIAPDMLTNVFEPFVQVDSSLMRAQGGLGIGLALVRTLAEMHGGAVEARSAGLGKGSTFIVRLPLSSAPVIEEVTPRPISDLRETQPLRVLVVDDNRDVAESMAILLQTWGHKVRTAFNGQTALELAQADPPDIVLCDLGMPGMDGSEVARRMRSLPGCDKVPLVAMTVTAEPEARLRTSETGFDYHLVKPIDGTALQALLGMP